MAEDDVTKLPAKPDSSASIPGLKGLDEAAGKALSPAAEEFGKEVVPLGKRAGQLTSRLGIVLIRTLEPFVYGWEKAADYVEKVLPELLKDIPPEKIVPPNPRIAVPAMQALTYSLDDELIRKMFLNLLAADMNADHKKDAHPAFVEVIKEMTPADARVLLACRNGQCSFTVRIGSENSIGSESRFLTQGTHYSFEVEKLSPDDISISLNNLERLGLLESRMEYPILQNLEELEHNLMAQYEERRQEFDQKAIKQVAFGLSESEAVTITIKRNGLYLNPLGINFVRICLK